MQKVILVYTKNYPKVRNHPDMTVVSVCKFNPKFNYVSDKAYSILKKSGADRYYFV